LTREQYERQDDFESGYEVKDYTMIATELQDECEGDDTVLYPIHIESDEYHQEGPATLIEWFREFLENYLDVPFHDCRLYFSGNRSIHVHVPRFISGEDQRARLKELAETFCSEKGAGLDCGLYYAKRMFRLPGVEHAKSGLPKVEIQPWWEHDRIIQEASEVTPSHPHSYADVLEQVFVTPRSLTVEPAEPPLEDPLELFHVLDSDKTILEMELEELEVQTPLIEQKVCPKDSGRAINWLQYNSKEFSPYAYAAANPRSVAAVMIKERAFARKNKRDGATMIPAYFYGAVGANGEYTKEKEHGPLQLSPQDYGKWDFQPTDTVVIIGGQSRSSKILEIDQWQATVVGHALTGEGGSREAALDYLEAEGYDTGSAGSTATSTSRSREATSEVKQIWPARENPRTEAEALQRQAEEEGIGTLTHPERIQVACRNLQYGWKPTWDWFREQFGSSFKPKVTWKWLKNIVEESDFEEYDHIEVPEEPF
jgi:hypothetical protein